MAISGLSAVVRKNRNGLVAEEDIDNIRKEMEYLRAWSAAVDLQSVKPKAERILEALLPGVKAAFIRDNLQDLQERIEDELESRQFLYVPPALAEYYVKPLGGWSEVADRFPSAQFDVEEAGKCLALGRHTACVFHLMRVMESGVQALATLLNVTLPQQKVWQGLLDEINKAIKALPPKDAKTVAYAAATANLYNVKLAWRNEVMHPKAMYTDEEAARVLDATRAFMQDLAALV